MKDLPRWSNTNHMGKTLHFPKCSAVHVTRMCRLPAATHKLLFLLYRPSMYPSTSTSIFPSGVSAEKRNIADSSPILDFSIIMFNARSFLPTVTQTLWPRFSKTWSWLKENIIVKRNRISWDYIYSDHGYYFPSNAEVRNMADSSPFSITIFKTRTFLPPVTHAVACVSRKKLSWLKEKIIVKINCTYLDYIYSTYYGYFFYDVKVRKWRVAMETVGPCEGNPWITVGTRCVNGNNFFVM